LGEGGRRASPSARDLWVVVAHTWTVRSCPAVTMRLPSGVIACLVVRGLRELGSAPQACSGPLIAAEMRTRHAGRAEERVCLRHLKLGAKNS